MIEYDEFSPCYECEKSTNFDELHECFDVRERKWIFVCEDCIEENN